MTSTFSLKIPDNFRRSPGAGDVARRSPKEGVILPLDTLGDGSEFFCIRNLWLLFRYESKMIDDHFGSLLTPFSYFSTLR